MPMSVTVLQAASIAGFSRLAIAGHQFIVPPSRGSLLNLQHFPPLTHPNDAQNWRVLGAP